GNHYSRSGFSARVRMGCAGVLPPTTHGADPRPHRYSVGCGAQLQSLSLGIAEGRGNRNRGGLGDRFDTVDHPNWHPLGRCYRCISTTGRRHFWRSGHYRAANIGVTQCGGLDHQLSYGRWLYYRYHDSLPGRDDIRSKTSTADPGGATTRTTSPGALVGAALIATGRCGCWMVVL